MPKAAKRPEARQFKANLPPDILDFLMEEAVRFGSSVNSEITRAVRERMERGTAATRTVYQAYSPVAATNITACQGGDIITNGFRRALDDQQ